MQRDFERKLRNRVAIRYAVTGDIRFISHHDTLRLFERALARAEIPVRFSEGFNPRPRMTIALPRSVGVASSDELLVLELASPMTSNEVLLRLAKQMPEGLSIVAADALADGDRRLPCEARYELSIDPNDADRLARRASDLLAQPSLTVTRIVPKETTRKVVDIRPYIVAIDVADGRVCWTQSITPTGTARPDETLDALGLPSRDHLHRLLRQRVRYEP